MGPNVVRFKITRKGKPLSDLIKRLKNVKQNLAPELEGIIHQVEVHLRTYINAHTHKSRPAVYDKNRLANAFKGSKASIRGKTVSVTLGNLTEIRRKHPYWLILNDGGFTPPTTIGYFGNVERPIPGGRGQSFRYTGLKSGHKSRMLHQRGFKMVPKKPITAINYIQDIQNYTQILLNRKIKDKFYSKIMK